MIPWADFAPRCAVFAADVPPYSVADQAIESARTFFEDSRAWRAESISLGSTVAAQALYTWGSLPAEAEVCGVPSLWLGKRKLREALPGESDELQPGSPGLPERVRHTASGVQLLPAPNFGGEAIVATLALCPARTAAGLPAAVFAQHRDTIVHHILSVLMLHQGRSYSSPSVAAWHQNEYERKAIDAASLAGPRSSGPYRTRMAPF